jgi:hypothetical protein
LVPHGLILIAPTPHENERARLLKDMKTSYVEVFIALIREADTPHDLEQYFNLLSTFCVAGKDPLEEIQSVVCRLLADLIPKTIPQTADQLQCTRKGELGADVLIEHREYPGSKSTEHYAAWTGSCPRPTALRASFHSRAR